VSAGLGRRARLRTMIRWALPPWRACARSPASPAAREEIQRSADRCSLTASRCDVALVEIRMGASLRMAARGWPRAGAGRSESCAPRSPTTGLEPIGRPSTNSVRAACSTAAMTPSRSRQSREPALLFRSVCGKRVRVLRLPVAMGGGSSLSPYSPRFVTSQPAPPAVGVPEPEKRLPRWSCRRPKVPRGPPCSARDGDVTSVSARAGGRIGEAHERHSSAGPRAPARRPGPSVTGHRLDVHGVDAPREPAVSASWRPT